MALDTNNLINRIDTLVEGYTTHDLTVSDDAMRSTPEPHNEPDELDDLFGEVIHTYTRAQAIADGTLVAVPERLAREAGLRAPVAITRAAWEDCVAWDDADNRRKGTIQDEDGRLWEVLTRCRDVVQDSTSQCAHVVLSNGRKALVHADDLSLVANRTWHFERGYAVTTVIRSGVQSKIYMHRLILPTPPGFEVDHRNGHGLDNRRGNLRVVTHSQNAMNARVRSDNRSGFRGVSWESQTGRWRARIRAAGRDISLGRFRTREEAFSAYVEAANELHGEYALQARPTPFTVCRVPRPGDTSEPRQVHLDVVAGPGDQGELVLTIMQQDED